MPDVGNLVSMLVVSFLALRRTTEKHYRIVPVDGAKVNIVQQRRRRQKVMQSFADSVVRFHYGDIRFFWLGIGPATTATRMGHACGFT